ncbi:MAG: hypothetical protein ACR2L8_16990, partial [Solirubrobacteraceae bacterium]
LYVAAERTDARAEYAPTERAELRRPAREQLEAALSRSEAESLALDVGRPLYRERARGLGR